MQSPPMLTFCVAHAVGVSTRDGCSSGILQEWACRSQELGLLQEPLEEWGGYRGNSQEPVIEMKEFPSSLQGMSTDFQ